MDCNPSLRKKYRFGSRLGTSAGVLTHKAVQFILP